MTQLAIIAAYLALLLILGGVASRLFRGTAGDYMLASHTIGPVLLLMSLFGTTMTAFALVGSTGEAYVQGVGVYGLLASSSGIVHSLCFFLVGVRLWAVGRRYGYRTQIQYFRDRLGSDKIGLVLFPVLVGLVVPYVLMGIIGAGAVINGVTKGAFPDAFPGSAGGVPNWMAAGAICIVVLLYVFFGGMRATAWANTFQTLVFMTLGVVTFYIIATRLGEQDSLLANLRLAAQAVPESKLTREHIPKLTWLTYLLIPLSVGMFPHVFQHWLTARSAASFKLPVVAHPIFILIVWLPCVLVGVWAASPLAAVPSAVRANEVLAFMVKNLAGDVLGGFLTAGILAAIMSSLDSQFLCLGTMFTEDIVVHYGGEKRFDDRRKVLLARGFVIAVVAVTYGLSLVMSPRVFQLGVWCFAGFASLFPLAVAAIYWRRLTLYGAYASIFATIAVWLILFGYAVSIDNLAYTIYGMDPVAVVFACSTAALILVSLLTTPPDENRLARFFRTSNH